MVKFNDTLDMYWSLKVLLGKVLVEHGEALNELIL